MFNCLRYRIRVRLLTVVALLWVEMGNALARSVVVSVDAVICLCAVSALNINLV